jgi:hypothetical protein
MAEEVIRQRIDDLARAQGLTVQADQTIPFSLDGIAYTIDLSEANAQRLRDALDEFVRAATPLFDQSVDLADTGSRARRQELARVRGWARDQGFQVSDRGRVPTEIVKKFVLANGPLRHQNN